MADYKSALWIPNKNFFANTGKKSFVILHGTAGGTSAQNTAAYFQSTEDSNNPVSSHYIVGKDGMVVQCVLEKDGAYGNGVVTNSNWQGNPNYYTISIEHIKSQVDNSDALTPEQQAASFALVKDICERNGIAKQDADDNSGITGHFSIDPVNRARCPGPYPWQELFNYLGNQQEEQPVAITLSTPGVSNYFVAAPNGAWHCPSTNATAGGAILDFYCKFGNSGLNGITWLGLPTTSEIGGIPGLPGVVLQRFECGVLIYDPNGVNDKRPGGSGPVYLMHIDKGIGEDPRVTDLSGQVAVLQKELDANVQAQEITALQAKIAQAVKDLS